MFTLLLGLLGIAGLIIRGCVSLSKDKPRASLARAITVSVWLAYDIILFATDVPNILATKCTCVLFFVGILSLRLDLGWIASVLLVVLSYCLQDLAHIIYGEETLQANSWCYRYPVRGYDFYVLRARRIPTSVNFGLGLIHNPSGMYATARSTPSLG